MHDHHLDFTAHKTRQRDAFVTVLTRLYRALVGFPLVPQVSTEEYLAPYVCKEDSIYIKLAVEKQSTRLLEIARVRNSFYSPDSRFQSLS